MDTFSSKKRPDYLVKAIIFLASQAISTFGSSLVQFAIVWYIAKVTNSGLMIAVSTLCSFVPSSIVALFAGVWTDRYHRKKLIILADGTIAASTLLLALFMMFSKSTSHLWAIFLISAIRSAGSGVQGPAINALIPQLVPEDQLMRMNSLQSSITSVVNLVSPAVGGAILSLSAFHNLLFIDVVTAVIGIAMLLFVPVKMHEGTLVSTAPNYIADFKQGLQYSFSHPFIKRLLIFYVVFAVLMVPGTLLNVLLVTRVFGDSYWNLTLNEMSFFIGAVLSGMILAAWGGFKNRLHTILLGCVVFGILTAAMGLSTNFIFYLCLMLLTGCTVALFNSPIMVLLQEKVEPGMQGRVFSLVQIVGATIMPLAMAGFGPLADIIPIQWMVVGSGVLMAAAGVGTLGAKTFIAQGVAAKPSV